MPSHTDKSGLLPTVPRLSAYLFLTSNITFNSGAQIESEKYAQSIFTPVSALSFMLFNQLCIPCFAATGAMREEMNDKKWACFTLIYQSLFAYAIALMVYQFGSILVLKTAPTVWTFIAGIVLLFMLYMLFRKPKVVKVEAKRAVSI